MQRVLYALTPVIIAAVYLFGWRVLVMLAVANLAAVLTEYAFTRTWKEPVQLRRVRHRLSLHALASARPAAVDGGAWARSSASPSAKWSSAGSAATFSIRP